MLLPSSLSWNTVQKSILYLYLVGMLVWVPLAPAKERSAWFWFEAGYEAEFWLPIKERGALSLPIQLLDFHISILYTSINLFWVLFALFFLFPFFRCVNVYMYVHAHMTCCACGSWKTACGSQFPLSTLVVPSGWTQVIRLQARDFNQRVTSLVSPAVIIPFSFRERIPCIPDWSQTWLCSQWLSRTVPVLLYTLKCWDHRHVL